MNPRLSQSSRIRLGINTRSQMSLILTLSQKFNGDAVYEYFTHSVFRKTGDGFLFDPTTHAQHDLAKSLVKLKALDVVEYIGRNTYKLNSHGQDIVKKLKFGPNNVRV